MARRRVEGRDATTRLTPPGARRRRAGRAPVRFSGSYRDDRRGMLVRGRRGDRVGRADQREVAERLREVPDLPRARDIVFLGEEPEVVRQPDEPVEEGTCL